MEDKDIVDLYWKRDENAIKLTQEKYEKYLMKIAVNILGDYQESEQSVNDTYLAAWNSMPDNRPDILSVYLGKITRRISISIHRMKNRIKRGGSEFDLSYEELSDCMADKNSPGDELEANRAHINFSYDGQLTFVQGSHNKIDRSKDYDKIDENKALDIAYSYLIEEKDRNDDGLPWNYIILDTSEDMNVQCAEKMVYRTDEDTVAWMVELILKTEEGEEDSMFNPLVHIYIDAAEGKVLNMNYTDGE